MGMLRKQEISPPIRKIVKVKYREYIKFIHIYGATQELGVGMNEKYEQENTPHM